MKKHFASFVVVLCITFFSTYPLHAETIDLFVLGGQSNMLGNAGDASEYPADPKGMDQKIRLYWVTPPAPSLSGLKGLYHKIRFYWVTHFLSSSQGKWSHLQPQDGIFPRGHFGPEITFARDLLAEGYHPGIFKYSQGNTSLAEDWKAPGENGLYDKMVAELSKAIEQLSKQGHTVRVRAFVWIQGEGDARTKEMAEAYGQRLKTLIYNFRVKVAKNPELPVILGVDEQNPLVKLNSEVVTYQQQITAGDAHSMFTSMEGLKKADSTHLTPGGLQAHGERLFAAFIKLSKKLP